MRYQFPYSHGCGASIIVSVTSYPATRLDPPDYTLNAPETCPGCNQLLDLDAIAEADDGSAGPYPEERTDADG